MHQATRESGQQADGVNWIHDEIDNVKQQAEVWLGTWPSSRITALTYDDDSRLYTEEVAETGAQTIATTPVQFVRRGWE